MRPLCRYNTGQNLLSRKKRKIKKQSRKNEEKKHNNKKLLSPPHLRNTDTHRHFFNHQKAQKLAIEPI